MGTLIFREEPRHPLENADNDINQNFLLRQVGHCARLVAAAIRPRFTEQMAGYQLRRAEFAVLSLVEANPGISQKRLADAIYVSPPNMAAIMASLVKRGLIKRKRAAGDARVRVLSLSEAGRKLYAMAAVTVERLELEATAMLSDEERAELLRLLRKVIRHSPPIYS